MRTGHLTFARYYQEDLRRVCIILLLHMASDTTDYSINGLRWTSFPRLLGHLDHKLGTPGIFKVTASISSLLVESCVNYGLKIALLI